MQPSSAIVENFDEVAWLQAALCRAEERRRQGAVEGFAMDRSQQFEKLASLQQGQMQDPALYSHVFERFDSAVNAYGVQLKSWIDLQVEARLNQFIQGLEVELLGLKQDIISALSTCDRVEGEVAQVTEQHARLFAFVEGNSEELARLKASVTAVQINTSAAWEKEGSSLAQQIARHEALLLEQRKLHEQHESGIADIRRIHIEMGDRHNVFAGGLAEITGFHKNTRNEIDNLSSMLRQLEQQTSTRQESVIDLSRLEGVESRMQAAVTQASLEELRLQLVETIRNQIVEVQTEAVVLEDLRGKIELVQQESAGMQDLRKHVEEVQVGSIALQAELEVERRERLDSQVRFGEDLTALQNKILVAVRSEMTAAFRSEAAAVTALDEQVWLKDQQLRQRIDQAANMQMRERIAIIERSGGLNGKDLPSAATEALKAQAPELWQSSNAAAANEMRTLGDSGGPVGLRIVGGSPLGGHASAVESGGAADIVVEERVELCGADAGRGKLTALSAGVGAGELTRDALRKVGTVSFEPGVETWGGSARERFSIASVATAAPDLYAARLNQVRDTQAARDELHRLSHRTMP